MLTKRSTPKLLRGAVQDERACYEILRAYTWNKIQRGNSRTSISKKLARISERMGCPAGSPFARAYRTVTQNLAGSRSSWGGKSVVGSLSHPQSAATHAGVAAWGKASGGTKKYNKLLANFQDGGVVPYDDEGDDDYAGTGWQQQEPILVPPPRQHSVETDWQASLSSDVPAPRYDGDSLSRRQAMQPPRYDADSLTRRLAMQTPARYDDVKRYDDIKRPRTPHADEPAGWKPQVITAPSHALPSRKQYKYAARAQAAELAASAPWNAPRPIIQIDNSGVGTYHYTRSGGNRF